MKLQGRRQSTNIIDARDHNSKTYKIENAKGKIDNNTYKIGTKVRSSKSVSKISDENTKNLNTFMNSVRENPKLGSKAASRLKNIKLAAPKQTFKKKK